MTLHWRLVPVLAGRDFNSESKAGQVKTVGLVNEGKNIPLLKELK
jgi:hypothetical protein